MNLIYFFLKHQTTSFFGAYISKIKPSSLQPFLLRPPSAVTPTRQVPRQPRRPRQSRRQPRPPQQPRCSSRRPQGHSSTTGASRRPQQHRRQLATPTAASPAARDAHSSTASSSRCPQQPAGSPPAPRHPRFVSKFQQSTFHYLRDFNMLIFYNGLEFEGF